MTHQNDNAFEERKVDKRLESIPSIVGLHYILDSE